MSPLVAAITAFSVVALLLVAAVALAFTLRGPRPRPVAVRPPRRR